MQSSDESSPLLNHRQTGELSLIFSIICIIDVFGVFPVVALPKAIIDCGFYGIAIVGIVCIAQMYTAILLGKCWTLAQHLDPLIESKNRYPYSALAEFTYGRCLSKCVSFLLDITVFGAGIPNLIVASQNLELLFERISNSDDTNSTISYCYWILIVGAILCPILWLGSPKDMKLLCSISVALVILVFILITACLLSNPFIDTRSFETSAPIIDWEHFFIAYGIISFQFDIHPSILTIHVDMKHKSDLNRAVIGGFAISLMMFSVVTVIAAFKFGFLSQPSILETLSTTITIPLHLAAFFIAIQLVLSSAVSNSALYQHMEDCMDISRHFNHRRCVLRTTLTLFAILIAEIVPRFDLVMSLIGGTLTGPLVFMLPPLFYIKIITMKTRRDSDLAMESFLNVDEIIGLETKYRDERIRAESHSHGTASWIRFEIVLCISIAILGACCTVVTTFVNVRNALKFSDFKQPCIYNVSSELLAKL